jgi:hypothetical protein
MCFLSNFFVIYLSPVDTIHNNPKRVTKNSIAMYKVLGNLTRFTLARFELTIYCSVGNTYGFYRDR